MLSGLLLLGRGLLLNSGDLFLCHSPSLHRAMRVPDDHQHGRLCPADCAGVPISITGCLLMSSRVAACVSLLFAASVANALDWGDFALVSDRSEDPLLIEVILSSDLGQAIGICEGVGSRHDPAAGAVIEAIVTSGGSLLRTETLLRALLARLLDPDRTDPPLAERLAANADAIDMLARAVSLWVDPQLVAALVRVLPLVEGPDRLRALVDVGDRIISAEDRGRGLLSPQETALAMEWLAAVRSIGSRDLLFSCVQVARLSADVDLVSAARETARALGSPGA